MKAASEGSLTVAADLVAGGVKHRSQSQIVVPSYSSFIALLIRVIIRYTQQNVKIITRTLYVMLLPQWSIDIDNISLAVKIIEKCFFFPTNPQVISETNPLLSMSAQVV